jgi:hypothetical protein
VHDCLGEQAHAKHLADAPEPALWRAGHGERMYGGKSTGVLLRAIFM